MEFRARSCMKEPAIQFLTFFAAIANKPDYRRSLAHVATELGAITNIARIASTDSESCIRLPRHPSAILVGY